MARNASSTKRNVFEANYERILTTLGEVGLYQKRLLLLLMAGSAVHGIWVISIVFTMAVPQHRCAVPGLHNDTFDIQNEEHGLLVNTSIPFDHSKGSYSKCFQYKTNQYNLSSVLPQDRLTPCSGWVYSRAVSKSSIVSDLNLVCHRGSYVMYANMMSLAGLMAGSLIIGPMCDYFGRKRVLVVILPAHVIIACASAFAMSVPVFLLSRLVGTFFSVGIFSCVWLLGLETVSRGTRVYANSAIMYGWILGLMFDVLLAFFIREWKTLNLALEVPKIILALACPWIFSESPLWLMSKSRYSEAKDIIRNIAKTNKVHLPENLFTDLSGMREPGLDLANNRRPEDNNSHPAMVERNVTLLHTDETPPTVPETNSSFKRALLQQLKSPIMMIRILVLAFNWLVTNMVYNGFQLNVGFIVEGNVYLSVFVMGVLELITNTLVLYALLKSGRKIVYCSCLLLSSVICIATIAPIYLPEGYRWLNITLTTLGKLSIAGAVATMWLYTAELLPTTLRQSGVGFCGFVCRFGGLISPFIVRLDNLVDGSTGKALTWVLFGAAALIAGVVSFMVLPETVGKKLPKTVAEAKNITIEYSPQDWLVVDEEAEQDGSEL